MASHACLFRWHVKKWNEKWITKGKHPSLDTYLKKYVTYEDEQYNANVLQTHIPVSSSLATSSGFYIIREYL